MALNRTLVGWAGAGITSLGAAAKYLPYSEECQQAIKGGFELLIRFECGPVFGNDDLILLVFVGGIALIVAAFWQDIAGFFFDKLAGDTGN